MAEVMVAFMLLSVISVILSGLIPATIQGMAKASQRTNAGLLADNELAVLRQTGFSAIEPTTAPHIVQEVADIEFTLQVEVAQASTSTGEMMDLDVAKMVTVTVTWTYQNIPHRLARRAVVFKRI